MTTATMTRPSEVPRSGGGGRAVALAVGMHVLLGALLFFGIRWQSSPPATIQAELWSAMPQTAAPAPRAVPPPPKVESPKPAPKVEEVKPEPKADIVEKAPPKVEKKKEPPKVEAKPEPKPTPAPPKVEAKVQPKTPPTPPTPAVPSDLKNLLAAADGPSAERPSTGKDAQTSGPRGDSKSYIARLVAAIRAQARYAATSPGNPTVRMRIEQLPTGEVVNVTMLNSSGVPAFDAAIERAVKAASPLPRNDQGGVARQLDLDYKMYETP